MWLIPVQPLLVRPLARAFLTEMQACVRGVDFVRAYALFAEDVVAFGTYAAVVSGRDQLEREQWRNVWSTIREFTFVLDELHCLGDDHTICVVVPWDSRRLRVNRCGYLHRPPTASLQHRAGTRTTCGCTCSPRNGVASRGTRRSSASANTPMIRPGSSVLTGFDFGGNWPVVPSGPIERVGLFSGMAALTRVALSTDRDRAAMRCRRRRGIQRTDRVAPSLEHWERLRQGHLRLERCWPCAKRANPDVARQLRNLRLFASMLASAMFPGRTPAQPTAPPG
jgi:hypothetical protein